MAFTRIQKGIYDFNGLILRRINTMEQADKFSSMVVVSADGSVCGVVGRDYTSLRRRLITFSAMAEYLLKYTYHEVHQDLYVDMISCFQQGLALGGQYVQAAATSTALVRNPKLVIPVEDSAASLVVADVFAVMSTAIAGRIRFPGHVPVYQVEQALTEARLVKPRLWRPDFMNVDDDQANLIFRMCTGQSVSSFTKTWRGQTEHIDQPEVVQVVDAAIAKALPALRVDLDRTPVDVPIHVSIAPYTGMKPQIAPYLQGWIDECPSQTYYSSSDPASYETASVGCSLVRLPSYGCAVKAPSGDFVTVGRSNHKLYLNNDSIDGADVSIVEQYRRPAASELVSGLYSRPIDAEGVWVSAESQFYRSWAKADLGAITAAWAIVPGMYVDACTDSVGDMKALSLFGPAFTDIWMNPKVGFDVKAALNRYSDKMNGSDQSACTAVSGVVENGALVAEDVIAAGVKSSASSGMLYTLGRLSVDTHCMTPLIVCNMLAACFDRDPTDFECQTVAPYLTAA